MGEIPKEIHLDIDTTIQQRAIQRGVVAEIIGVKSVHAAAFDAVIEADTRLALGESQTPEQYLQTQHEQQEALKREKLVNSIV